MTPRALLLLATLGLAAACADLTPGGAGLGDPCLASTDCVSPYICISGRCAPSSGQLCSAGQYRCNGSYVEKCSESGDAWESQSQCAIACVAGACTQPICVGGTQRCEGNTIMQCLPNGSGWVYVQTCTTSCQQDTTDERLSFCKAPSCTPFQTACDPNDGTLLTCNSSGTGWTPSTCGSSKTCIGGQCVAQICTASAERCNGNVAEACNETRTAWQAKPNGYCQNGCVMQGGVASCPAQICVPYASRCTEDQAAVETCNSFGTQWISPVTCPSDSICVSGACREQVCAAGSQRCQDHLVQECNTNGTGWETVQSCQYACLSTGASTVACAPPACAAGERRCCQPGDASCTAPGGQILEICNPDRSGFAFVQYCATGCAPTPSTTPPSASCKIPTCAPLDQRCVTNTSGQQVVQVCRADGTTWDDVELCAQMCHPGSGCIPDSTLCVPGEQRCHLDEVQMCARLQDGSFAWEFVDHCFGGCSEGVCLPGGSCGCSPTVAATTVATSCGGTASTAPKPVAVNLLQPVGVSPNSAAAPLPCNDGVTTSSFAVYTTPIVGADGTTVPDGTMVTFTNDSTSGVSDSLILSDDADPWTPGLQRPTRDGVAIAVVSAPSAANCKTLDATTQAITNGLRTVTVRAVVAGSCGGSLPIYFAAPTTVSHVNYVAEDFSSTGHLDAINTTGVWDTGVGAAGAVPTFSLGTCADGDFTPPTGAFALDATNFMPGWDVTSLGNQSAVVSQTVSAVRPGDEVLLATVWGPSGSTGGPGKYEFHRVATVDNTSGFARITFTEPINLAFGNGTNLVLAGHRVILQRVPQFRNLTVPATTVLTANAMTATNNASTGGTGILAFRACGVVSVTGDISMDAKGLPQNLGSYPNTTSTASLSRFLPGPPASTGSGPTTSGGGVIFITAGTLNFTTSSAKIHASSTSGGGGMVWVAGPKMQFSSQTRVVATGGTTGMTRIDTSSPDWALSSPSPVPMTSTLVQYSANGGKVGPVNVQTGRLFLQPSSTGQLVRSATLTGLIGGSGSTSAVFQLAAGSTQLIPGVNLSVTANGNDAPPTWTPLDSGTANITSLQGDVRFKLTLAPTTDKELLVRAVAFSVFIQ